MKTYNYFEAVKEAYFVFATMQMMSKEEIMQIVEIMLEA